MGSASGEPHLEKSNEVMRLWVPPEQTLAVSLGPQTPAQGGGAPPSHSLPLPTSRGFVDINRVSQGQGEGEEQGPRMSQERAGYFPCVSSLSGGARDDMSNRIPDAPGRVNPERVGEVKCMTSSSLRTLALTSPELWDSVTRPYTGHPKQLGNKDPLKSASQIIYISIAPVT